MEKVKSFVKDTNGKISTGYYEIDRGVNMEKEIKNELSDKERDMQISSLRASVKHFEDKIKEYEDKKQTALKLVDKLTQGE